MACVVGTLGLAACKKHPSGGTKTWTVFVYGHGDHTLSNSLVVDMQEMARARFGASTRLVIAADWDASQAVAGTDPPEPFPVGTELYAPDGKGNLGEPESLPELDFDDPQVLRTLLAEVIKAQPSDRYAVILWDHGGSWRAGFGSDTQNGTDPMPTAMPITKVAEALRGAAADAGLPATRPFDIVAFDTCLLATQEVAYEFRDIAHVFIGDAEIDYGNGWDYEKTLTYLDQHRDAPATEIAMAEVGHWDAHHRNASLTDAILRAHAAIDLSRIDAFTTSTKALLSTYGSSDAATRFALARDIGVDLPAYLNSGLLPNVPPELRDVGQLLSHLGTDPNATALASSARAANAALSSMILASSMGTLRESAGQKGLHGELPLGSTLDATVLGEYGVKAPGWSTDSGWGAFLRALDAAADATAPVFSTALTQAASGVPTVTISPADADVSRLTAMLLESTGSQLNVLGLIGTAPIEPGFDYTVSWSGTALALPDPNGGLQRTTVDVVLDLGVDSQGNPIAPLLGVYGALATTTASVDALLIFQDGDASASLIAITENGGASVNSIAEWRQAIGGGLFVPTIATVDVGTGEFVLAPGTPIPLPAAGEIPITSATMPAGDYAIMTSVGDVWGNDDQAFDVFTLTAPIPQ